MQLDCCFGNRCVFASLKGSETRELLPVFCSESGDVSVGTVTEDVPLVFLRSCCAAFTTEIVELTSGFELVSGRIVPVKENTLYLRSSRTTTDSFEKLVGYGEGCSYPLRAYARCCLGLLGFVCISCL